jgi:DNA-binding transcriptional LysR family regulator
MIIFPFNLDQLIIFKIIIHEGSFKKASKKLYLSQPAISFQIRQLEQKINILLFQRKKKTIYLTEAGYLLLKYSTRILGLCEETFYLLKKLKTKSNDNKHNQILLGASQNIGTYLFPYIIGIIQNRYPQIKFYLYVYSTRRIIWYLLTKKIDLAIIEGKIPYNLKDLINAIPYAEEEFLLILPYYYSFLNIQKVKKKELTNLNFIFLESKALIKKILNQVLFENKIELKFFLSKIKFSSIEGIKNGIYAGLGVSFLPISSITNELNKNLVYSIRIEKLILKQRIFIITNKSKIKSKYLNYFIQELLAIFLTLPKEKN